MQNGSILAVSLAFKSTVSYDNEPLKLVLEFATNSVPNGFWGHIRVYYPSTEGLTYIRYSSTSLSIKFDNYNANTNIHENWVFIV